MQGKVISLHGLHFFLFPLFTGIQCGLRAATWLHVQGSIPFNTSKTYLYGTIGKTSR